MDLENVKTLVRGLPSGGSIEDTEMRQGYTALREVVMHLADYIESHEKSWLNEPPSKKTRTGRDQDYDPLAVAKNKKTPEPEPSITASMSIALKSQNLTLVNDQQTIAANQFYGTDKNGTRVWRTAGTLPIPPPAPNMVYISNNAGNAEWVSYATFIALFQGLMDIDVAYDTTTHILQYRKKVGETWTEFAVITTAVPDEDA